MQLEELFCNIDDFYLNFQESINFNLLENEQRKTRKISRLSLSRESPATSILRLAVGGCQ